MKRLMVGAGAVILVILGGLLAGLYSAAGLREYLTAIVEMRRLPAEQAAAARDNFFTLGEPDLYGGILAGFWQGKIWIWGRQGLRAFQPDGDSVYSFFSACRPEILAQAGQGRPVAVGRSIDTEMAQWRARVKTGNYVTAALAAAGSGGVRGHLREIYGYDWQVFIPGVLQKQCGH
jgi:hypothetical protein